MYKELKFKDFRLFKDQTIHIGKYITVLAGKNSTGKSTVLGILGNSSEIKKKDGVTYAGKQFRAEFGEIFHGSKKFDLSASDRAELTISDNSGAIVDYRKFRTSWQKDGEKDRFRIIPSKLLDGGKKTEAKLAIPVYYLGLSRLFPIGESEEDTIKSAKLKFNNADDKAWFIEQYRNILSLYDTIEEISNLSIGETTKKSGIGIETSKYDYLTNSAGQDNLGQILMAVLSFKKLKEEYASSEAKEWNGGLLLIDEVDSTLHPAAQKRLINLLISQAKQLCIQIVVTTHSSDLLKHICTKTTYNNTTTNNDVELYYFTNSNRRLYIKRNIDFSTIESDLLVQSMLQRNDKIKLYSEDSEGRWFIKKLIPEYLSYIELLDVRVGCNQLMSLYTGDISYFGNCIIVFDGDVTENDLNAIPQHIRNKLKNIIKLPGVESPEKVIYDYLLSLPPEHGYWEEADKIEMNWTYFKENGPDSENYRQEKDRERCKKWFTDHESFFDTSHLFDYWLDDNETEANKFKENFKKSYNSIATRTFAVKID